MRCSTPGCDNEAVWACEKWSWDGDFFCDECNHDPCPTCQSLTDYLNHVDPKEKGVKYVREKLNELSEAATKAYRERLINLRLCRTGQTLDKADGFHDGYQEGWEAHERLHPDK